MLGSWEIDMWAGQYQSGAENFDKHKRSIIKINMVNDMYVEIFSC